MKPLTAIVALLVCAASAGAAQPAVSLNDYIVTTWTTKDGLPSDVIWTIAQDRQGYLWLGTNGGLVRFDGVRFVSWSSVGGTALPNAPVRTVFVARDGALWIGFGFNEVAGVARVDGARVRMFGEADGLVRSAINALVEDTDGTIWTGTNLGLFRLNGERWERVDSARGMPPERIDSLYRDRRGALLVGSAAGVFRKARGSTAFQRVDSSDAAPPVFRGFSEDHDGRIWVTDPVGAFRVLGDRSTPFHERGRGNTLLHDRDGNLWVTTMGEGIWRVTRGAATTAAVVEKARAPGARAIFEDHDGQIWAGNGDGLIRLAPPKVTPVTTLGLVYGVQTTPDGSVWVTTPDRVFRANETAFDAETRTGFLTELRQPGVRTLRADERGVLWVATSSSLVRFANDRRVYALPLSAKLNRINSIDSDRLGGLWISDRDRGVFRWNPARPDVVEPLAALGDARLSTMVTSADGRLWFATTAGQIGVLDRSGRVQTFGAETGVGQGPFTGLYEDSHHVLWTGASDGLRGLIGSRFVHINMGRRLRIGVVGIVEDADGDLWIGTGSGIMCVTRAEIEKAVVHPEYEVNSRVFDSAADGLAGLPVTFGNPSEVREASGRLWFVTGRGLTALDPRALKSIRAATTVKIESAQVDERAFAVAAGARLPRGADRLAIDYSVLDLATPWRTQFKYQLEGFDSRWIDAGTHRQAVYTHLPPGNYRFRVAASNADGSWSEASAEWPFVVAPMFYQTYWFYASSLVALAVALWAAWKMRVRRIRRQFALLIGERARLSREIHDTLLQSLVGVALQFDALSANMDAASPERQQLIRIRKEVEGYIREARHSIWNLRKPVIGQRDLAAAIREAARRVTSGHAVGFGFTVVGTPFPCPPETEEQLVRICQEAVLNAVRHANPSNVHVELRYESDAIVLHVTDDGLGFDPETIVPLEAAGHYGLVSMRERAAQVGGVFTLRSSQRAGTSIEARVPAAAQA